MDLEQQLRSGENLEDLEIPFDDPLLVVYIRAIDVFWAFKRGAASGDLESRLAALGRGDLAFAANEFVRRARARNH